MSQNGVDAPAETPPPELPTSSGTGHSASSEHTSTGADTDKLATQLASAQVGDTHDEPDLSLRLREGLNERPEAEITTQAADGSIYTSASKFEDLPLSPELLQGLYVEMKFERPSRIQASTLPMILTPPHADLVAQAHNGSGKTTCFVLSMLSRVEPELNKPQALCMCPTRELVLQNLSVVERIGKFSSIRSTSTALQENQKRRVPVTEQVVIGTHGRMKAWVNMRLLALDSIRILVFDEADEMLKMDSFAEDSVRLIKSVRKANPEVQLLLFSATFNDQVKTFTQQISPKANRVLVAREQLSLDVIAQYNVQCPDRTAKTRVLQEMIFPNCERLGQTIIFVRAREEAKVLHDEMERAGYKCTSIRGDMEHSERDRVVNEFRDGITKILIATDVLSRGFDVSQVTLVINFDVPVERNPTQPAFETYLHRIGRSGRFGRKGVAFNLISTYQDRMIMEGIASYFNKRIEDLEWDNEDAFEKALQRL